LEDRAALARHRLPAAIKIQVGDAAEIDPAEEPFDIVYQSTVFTSILDEGFQQKLADRMWALTKPGGGVLWYDFIYNNPRNPDVRGVPLRRIRELFPHGKIHPWKITLAPPHQPPGNLPPPGALFGVQPLPLPPHPSAVLDSEAGLTPVEVEP